MVLKHKERVSRHILMYRRGFTIVELLIVVVVIAILAAIALVSYSGIQDQARASAVQSNLSQIAKSLEIDKLKNGGAYPGSIEDSSASVPDDGEYSYRGGEDFYCLFGSVGGISYRVTNASMMPTEGTCSGVMSSGELCPANFIAVPGNSNLGTDEFCVMKYEAKNDGSGVAVSRAGGMPWVEITHIGAVSAATTACDGCHLITEAEWMTIAANVLSVPGNWTGSAVGSGQVYRGHSNRSPDNALEASTNDSDGYSGLEGAAAQRRRTLTLTNGEVIWDLSGNVNEWTAGVFTPNNVGIPGDTNFRWIEWNNPTLSLGNLPTVSSPSALASSPGLASIANWDMSNGIGRVYAKYNDDYSSRAIRRGGLWYDSNGSGVLATLLNGARTASSDAIGFRVAR